MKAWGGPSVFVACLLLSAVQAQTATSDQRHESVDACSVLSKSVIESVQGEPLTGTKASLAKSGGVLTSQCFYSLPTFSNSISVAVTLPDPGSLSRVGPRDVWRRFFHETENDKKEDESSPPVAVPGLGEEAYWVHSFVGTLYVLKGNAFLRLSIGGKRDDPTSLRKARVLAQDALTRMP